jgi:uncharacterized membrane protein YcaP (DUF421 family)
MFFDNWMGIGRVLVVGVLAYAVLVVTMRISGNRTLSKMNAFDLVVTVALGSTLATILLSADVALAEGVVALALLIGLQFAVTWLSVRSVRISHLVKSEPQLLLHQGKLLPGRLRAARVVEAEVLAAIREQGIGTLEDVDAVVLETNGSFSVIRRTEDGSAMPRHETG